MEGMGKEVTAIIAASDSRKEIAVVVAITEWFFFFSINSRANIATFTLTTILYDFFKLEFISSSIC